jgi:hypothetical protein
MASASIEITPFTAAKLQRMSDGERSDELTRIGMRFLRSNSLMRWDGCDLEFAADLAGRVYLSAIATIERANRLRAAA